MECKKTAINLHRQETRGLEKVFTPVARPDFRPGNFVELICDAL
jgi:hypothetical protein